jgi:hypothetical protein
MNGNSGVKLGGNLSNDYFEMSKNNKSEYCINDYIKQFNPNDYFIYKSTRRQKQVSIEDFLDVKFAGYILFKKGVYDMNRIDYWIDCCNLIGGIQFLHKPTPPFSPEKIIIRK